MSVILSVEQYPLTITPSNGEHIYTISSTGYTLDNFKYIIDIYFQPQTSNQQVARLKVRPNSYGKAIVDVEEIVRTLLKVNPRSSGTTYPYLNFVAEENSIITLMDAQRTRDYNAYNIWPGGSPNGNLDQLWHIEQYQVIVGCEYQSGSNIVVDIDETANFQPPAITIFPGVDNSLVPAPYLPAATLGSGYTGSPNFFQVDNQSWYYYDLFRWVYSQSGDCNCVSYEIANPDPDFYQLFTYQTCGGASTFGSVPPDEYVVVCACEGSVQAGTMFVTNLGVCDTWEPCGPKELLNAGCRDYKIISQDGYVNDKVRRRQHHRECPIVISFLNGKTDYFTNDVYSIGIKSAKSWSDPYTYSAESMNRYTSTLPTTAETPNSQFKLLNFYLPYNITDGGVVNAIPTDSRKLVFYGTSWNNQKKKRLEFSAATTELLEFYIQDTDCINNPTHFLFLNGRGMWDTYTFGKKSTKTIGVDRKKYRQESSLDKQFYARGSYQRGTTVYEQDASYEIECMSWYMTEGDKCIVEELFMSPEVYIITGTTITEEECPTCLEEIRLYQHLIPVVLKDSSFEVYQQQYQKLYQYTFKAEYASVKRYRTQG